MLHLASLESFLGSLWFGGLTLAVGYIAGHIFPINKLTGLFNKNR